MISIQHTIYELVEILEIQQKNRKNAVLSILAAPPGLEHAPSIRNNKNL